MTTTLIQMDIKWGCIADNCHAASQLIDANPGSDLYILPEMFSTGFLTDPRQMADHTGQTLQWMQQKAHETKAAICGSVAIGTTLDHYETYRNRFYFVASDGAVQFYDKHHLFSIGGENRHYTSGDTRTIIQWHGHRILLQICYDLRFPCFSRNHLAPTLEPLEPLYDSIVYVASWPTSRIQVWNTLLQARAIENQCYVFGINRIGTDPNCTYSGGTQAIDPYGRIISQCPDNTPSSITITPDLDFLHSFRQKFPVLNDAD